MQVQAMAHSKKRFDPARRARRRARAAAGLPPHERVVPDKRRKLPKHKKKLLEQELL
jgi:hypothetical protein